MSAGVPFDRAKPSPLAILRDLRSLAGEAVVGDGLTDVQRRMYQPGDLERRLIDAVTGDHAPDLVVIAGSAGGGKSAIIQHVLDAAGGSFGEYIADATHSEAPNESQIDRLAKFFAPFADGSERPGGPTRLIAMNTGMVLQFFKGIPEKNDQQSFRALEQYMKARLRVPLAHGEEYPPWMAAAVLVLNLDHRPTAGEPGDIFDLILQRLEPTSEAGVLNGSNRCETCQIISWCFPRANAEVISRLPARAVLNKAAGDVALHRGRNLPPRALWDFAARLALGGLNLDHKDPCDQIAEIAGSADVEALLRGLATGSALDETSGLAPEFVAVEPTFQPSGAYHDIVASASLDVDADAAVMSDCLVGEAGVPAAVEAAAAAIAEGRVAVQGRQLARIVWLGGTVGAGGAVPELFAKALVAQRHLDRDKPVPEESVGAVEYVARGLASGFGVTSRHETFFPTDDGGSPTRRTDVYVKADLMRNRMLWLSEEGDPVVAANPNGAAVVGYRPLTLAMRLAIGSDQRNQELTQSFDVNLPLWQLLGRAIEGTVPSSVDKERFLGLRRAMEAVGQLAGRDKQLPFLVHQRSNGKRFRLASGPTGLLRVSED